MALATAVNRLTPFTVVSPGVLVEQLDEISRGGVAVDREEARAGVATVASPVTGPGGRAVAALAVTGVLRQVDPDRLGPAVRTAALALSRQVAGGSHVSPAPLLPAGV